MLYFDLLHVCYLNSHRFRSARITSTVKEEDNRAFDSTKQPSQTNKKIESDSKSNSINSILQYAIINR